MRGGKAGSLLLLAVIVGLVIMGKRKYSELRGLRLNNPGNLRISAANAWLGKVTPSRDDEFETFESVEYGIRAIGKTLDTYFNVHNIDTIWGVANRYAPPSENDTGAYAAALSQEMGLSQSMRLYIPGSIAKLQLTKAIIKIEQGIQPYTDEFISDALALEA